MVLRFLFRLVPTRRPPEDAEPVELYDVETGLPNRAFFERRLAASLGSRRTIAVTLIRLDAADDGIVDTVARRVGDAVRADDLVARVGDDELAVLSESVKTSSALVEVTERILAAIAEPAERTSGPAALSACAGIAWCPSGETGVDEILATAARAADAAACADDRRYQLFSMPPRTRAA